MSKTLMGEIERKTRQNYGIHRSTAFLDFSVTKTSSKSTKESPWMASDAFWGIQPFTEKKQSQPSRPTRRSQTPQSELVTTSRPRKRSLYSF